MLAWGRQTHPRGLSCIHCYRQRSCRKETETDLECACASDPGLDLDRGHDHGVSAPMSEGMPTAADCVGLGFYSSPGVCVWRNCGPCSLPRPWALDPGCGHGGVCSCSRYLSHDPSFPSRVLCPLGCCPDDRYSGGGGGGHGGSCCSYRGACRPPSCHHLHCRRPYAVSVSDVGRRLESSRHLIFLCPFAAGSCLCHPR